MPSISLLIILGFAGAPLAGWLGGRSSPLVALIPALLFAGFGLLLWQAGPGAVLTETHPWIPSLGIEAGFRADGLSLAFALLITGIGSIVFLYGSAYLRGQRQLARFYTVLTLFMASMLGAVLADNLVLLAVFWELTSLTSFLLIGFSPERAETRRSAQQGLLITVAGGLALIAGVILLGNVAGSYSISLILQQADMVMASPMAPAIILLVAAGAFAKSAQVPLHSWLANAMVAPTPVSAFLHSATMVKLGVYLLARLNPVFDGHSLWIGLLCGVGTLTMLVGALLAMRETDLKRLLAYSTIVTLGTLVMLIGMPGSLAALATATFIIVHALYKACLFLVAGIVDHETGTRDASRLGGLRRMMPVTAFAALLGGLSMAGLPPFIGFIAKELVYEAGLAAPAAILLLGAALCANAAMVLVAGIVAWRCFFGQLQATPKPPHDPGFAMLAGPALLAGLGLLFGLLPMPAGEAIILPAAASIAGEPISYSFALWHGLTPMLPLSGVTVILGLLLLANWQRLYQRLATISAFERLGPDRCYDRVLEALQALARWQTAGLQSGSLRSYLGRVFAVIALGGLTTLLLQDGFDWPDFRDALESDLILVGLLVLAALAVLGARNFVSGIAAAGMVGFAVALLFLFQGAPDLAFTQFSVEALAIVILLAIVGRLPFRERDYRTRGERRQDGVVAFAVGMMATLVLLAVLAQPFDTGLSDFFRTTSVPEAHGRNLVNVIIVDFRALDTLGEITVLGLAAIAAAAVIAGLRLKKPEQRP